MGDAIRAFWDQLVSMNAATDEARRLPLTEGWLGNETGSPHHSYGAYNFRQHGHLLGRERVLFLAPSDQIIQYGERSTRKDASGSIRVVCDQTNFGLSDEFRISATPSGVLIASARQAEPDGRGGAHRSSKDCVITEPLTLLRNLGSSPKPRPLNLCVNLQHLEEPKPKQAHGLWRRLFGK